MPFFGRSKTTWLEFPKGRDGLSVSLAKASTSTTTYRCATMVYNQPTKGQVRNRSVHVLDALLGSGGVWGRPPLLFKA